MFTLVCSNKARLLRKAGSKGEKKKKRSVTAAVCACALAAAAVPGGEGVRSGPPDPKLRGTSGSPLAGTLAA